MVAQCYILSTATGHRHPPTHESEAGWLGRLTPRPAAHSVRNGSPVRECGVAVFQRSFEKIGGAAVVLSPNRHLINPPVFLSSPSTRIDLGADCRAEFTACSETTKLACVAVHTSEQAVSRLSFFPSYLPGKNLHMLTKDSNLVPSHDLSTSPILKPISSISRLIQTK